MLKPSHLYEPTRDPLTPHPISCASCRCTHFFPELMAPLPPPPPLPCLPRCHNAAHLWNVIRMPPPPPTHTHTHIHTLQHSCAYLPRCHNAAQLWTLKPQNPFLPRCHNAAQLWTLKPQNPFLPRCHNAAQLWNLGWAAPLATLNSSMQPGLWYTYTVPAVVTSPKNSVQVRAKAGQLHACMCDWSQALNLRLRSHPNLDGYTLCQDWSSNVK